MSEPGTPVDQFSDTSEDDIPENDDGMLPPMQHSVMPSIRLPRVVGGLEMLDPNEANYIKDPISIEEITSKAFAKASLKSSLKVRKWESDRGEGGGHGALILRPINPRKATTLSEGRHGHKTVSGDSQAGANAVMKQLCGIQRTSDDENDKENAICGNCKKGNGPFEGYVHLEGISHGCANCTYTGDNCRCSNNPNRHERQPPVAVKSEDIQAILQKLEDLAEMKDVLAEVNSELAEAIESCKHDGPSQRHNRGHKRSFSDIT